jgi:DNA-binding CsgD family transcriptional regulator
MDAGLAPLGVSGNAPGLLEREHELERLRAGLRSAADGAGCLLMVEGSAGLGKSRLLNAAAELGSESGLSVLRAQGEELETAVPWSLARALLSPALARAPAKLRRDLLEGAAGAAAELLEPERAPVDARESEGDAGLRLAHALLWLTAGLSERSPLALVIDDAHWADEPSLRFLAYLAPRLAELPVAVLLARRPREPGTEPGLLERIAGHPSTEVLALRPLCEQAVGTLARESLGTDVDIEVIAACMQATAGNPFYLRELLRELSSERDAGRPVDVQFVQQVAPAGVARSVLLRLAALGPEAVALTRAVAVLGGRASLPHAAALAAVELARASRALDGLAAAEMLVAEEPLRFVHPLVASAVYGDLGAGERGEWHLRAAQMLERDGAEPQRVAVHLLTGGRRGDQEVVSTLQAAARIALAQGASAVAADYLVRALEEPPTPDRRAELLSELGRIEASLGRPSAPERVQSALDLTTKPSDRAKLLFELGRAWTVAGEPAHATSSFEAGLAELDDPASELTRELRAAWWMSATLDIALRAKVLAAGDPDIGDDHDTPTRGQRQLLAQLAQQRALEGSAPSEVRALAERAWGDGELLAAESSDGVTWSLVTGALFGVDELERELEICDAVLADARRRGSPMAYATASYCRGWPLLHRGQVDDALADLQAALRAREDGWGTFVAATITGLSLAHIEQGALTEAACALKLAFEDPQLEQSIQYPLVLIGAARLLVAEGRPEQALDPLLRVGEIVRQAGVDCPALFPWRSDAAFAAALADKRDRARALAEDALADAHRTRVPRIVVRALRASAAAERGEPAIAYLREAVAIFANSPPRLEHAYALVDLGSALRRAHRRAEATDLLREGLQLAAGGARVLAERARVELAAAGARVGRDRASSGSETLTPSERRVASLAAAGHSNRDIAQMLFVTVKAVEYHLANTYRKLDIKRRSQLAPLLHVHMHDMDDRRDS